MATRERFCATSMAAKKYKVEIPDEKYFQSLVNCRSACPVGTNAGGYAALIAEKRFEEAYIEARRPNPFASICGRICAHPCESACRRKAIDEPVSIRALKRFVTTQYGVESNRSMNIRSIIGHPGKTAGKSGKSVAVIGAGPAGLSCAHDLALFGHGVTVFEASPVSGGMLYLGIPEYRLPRQLLTQEIEFIKDLGVDIHLNTSVGKDVDFKKLQNDYDAIFMGVGCTKARNLNIEGHDLDGVLKAIDFLLNVNLGYQADLGERVLIVGGGNVAFDVARSVARYGGTSVPDEEDHHAMMDVARLAKRAGARDVTLVSLESASEMPADPEEIVAGQEEGITIINSRGPKRIVENNGRVGGLETLDVASVFDEKGRFSPTFVDNTEKTLVADTIILAVGQESDLSFLGDDHGLALTERGFPSVDRKTCATSKPNIYAGGDMAFGPRIAIEAVAEGRLAARGIHRFLGFEDVDSKEIEIRPLNTYRFKPGGGIHKDYDKVPRNEPPVIPVKRRVGLNEVECTYEQEYACLEGARCLHCWVAPIFDSDRCIQCGGCADVCPEACLKLVNVSKLERDDTLLDLIQARYGHTMPEAGAIIKDEEACIRCGLCATRCPADAITMRSFTCEGDLIDD